MTKVISPVSDEMCGCENAYPAMVEGARPGFETTLAQARSSAS
jgi:hypothetical protein